MNKAYIDTRSKWPIFIYGLIAVELRNVTNKRLEKSHYISMAFQCSKSFNYKSSEMVYWLNREIEVCQNVQHTIIN